MNDFVVLTEEPSARIVAEALARRLGLAERARFIEHQGKSHLERSFPRKIAAWAADRPPRFVVMRDNDGAVCREKKAELMRLVPANRLSQVKIRLVMHELESWYLGDPKALHEAGLIKSDAADNWSKRAKFRDPDKIIKAKEAFRREVPNGGQIELARRIGPRLHPGRNRSASSHAFVGALKWAGAG